MKERKSWIALLALLLIFAACKGETPTAPPPGGNTPPGGSTPPAGANLVLTASNTTPLIDATVVVTATVTDNGSPVANGTAVEFVTSAGTFIDVTPGVTSIIRTTTNGVATVNLTSPTAGLARVTATVNNVTRSVDVTFRTTPPCVPPDPNCPVVTTPTIQSVTPNIGKPQGGETIRITGTNFIAPLRVLFDTGTGPVQATITDSGPNFIDVITPAVSLGAGQQLAADIIVVTKLGSGNEERVVANDAFTFRNTSLTPLIHSLSPTSGPINGGTRVTVFGEGFQAPVQVFFGAAEAHVIETQFSQILVEAPDARLTNPNGSGTVTGPVEVTVVNINSNTRGTSPQQFRYVSKMQITSVRPLVGSSVGGTDVTIDGIGFDSPVDVVIANVQATVIRVSGTQIVARTNSLANACAGASGFIVVRNVENGDFDVWGDEPPQEFDFAYIPVTPQILSTTSPVTAGTTLTAIVSSPGVGALGTATIRFDLGKGTDPQRFFTIIPSPSTLTSGTGTQPFSIAVPLTGFTFPPVACTTGGGAPGTQPGGIDVPLVFKNLTTGCTDTVTVRVEPASPVCVQAPPQAQLTAPASGCAAAVAPFPGSGNATITFKNNAAAGSQTLVVTGSAPTGANASDFSSPTPPSQNIAPGASASFNVTFTPSAAGSETASINFTTNDPANPNITVCLSGNQPPP